MGRQVTFTIRRAITLLFLTALPGATAAKVDGSNPPISKLCDVAIVCSGDRKPLLPLQFPENLVKTYIQDED
jgi:hypothetical protein